MEQRALALMRWMERKSDNYLIYRLMTPALLIIIMSGAYIPGTYVRFWALCIEVPILFFIVAFSAFSRFSELKQQIIARFIIEHGNLRALKWNDFEMFIELFFLLKGYEVERRGGLEPDGGIDLIVRQNERSFVVQCKHWYREKVGVKEIREMLGVRQINRADGMIFVTSGQFTDAVKEEMKLLPETERPELIDGAKLVEGIREQKDRLEIEGVSPDRQIVNLMNRMTGAVLREGEWVKIHRCPACGTRMGLKRNRENGEKFWGCPAYKQCGGKTESLSKIEREMFASF